MINGQPIWKCECCGRFHVIDIEGIWGFERCSIVFPECTFVGGKDFEIIDKARIVGRQQIRVQFNVVMGDILERGARSQDVPRVDSQEPILKHIGPRTRNKSLKSAHVCRMSAQRPGRRLDEILSIIVDLRGIQGYTQLVDEIP